MGYTEEFKRVLLSDPDCILGKKGITKQFIDYVKILLKKKKIIKIKLLKSIAIRSSIEELAIKIAEKTDSIVLDIRGRIVIISNPQIEKRI